MQFCNRMAKLHEFYAFQYCPWVKVMTTFPYLHSDTSATLGGGIPLPCLPPQENKAAEQTSEYQAKGIHNLDNRALLCIILDRNGNG